jgi:outer membrane immunogenic protein
MRTFVRIWLGSSALIALMCASSALAADLSRPVYTKAPPPAPPPFSWTGFYLGANIGGAWANGHLDDNFTGASFGFDNAGFIGGGQAGFNYQINNFVFGVEGDIDGTTMSKTGVGVLTPIGTLQGHDSTDWIATLTGRVGIAWDRWLWYAKGGGAWLQESATLTNLTTGVSAGNSTTLDGWTAGVGVEWAFYDNWSAKLEYDYIGLNNWSPATSNIFVNDFVTLHGNVQVFKAGINYRFGGWGGY